jgi:hypothetical protein
LSFRLPSMLVLSGIVTAGVAFLVAWGLDAHHVIAFYVSLAMWGPFVAVAGILVAGECLFSELKGPGKGPFGNLGMHHSVSGQKTRATEEPPGTE